VPCGAVAYLVPAAGAQQAKESIRNEEVQVYAYIILVLQSSNWIHTPLTNGHALENVGGLPFLFLYLHTKEPMLNLINLCN